MGHCNFGKDRGQGNLEGNKNWHQNVMCQWKRERQGTTEEREQLFLHSTSHQSLILNSIKC